MNPNYDNISLFLDFLNIVLLILSEEGYEISTMRPGIKYPIPEKWNYIIKVTQRKVNKRIPTTCLLKNILTGQFVDNNSIIRKFLKEKTSDK